MNDQIKTEQQNEARASPSELNDGLDRIKSVIDRVLWTARATECNKRMLAEAIADELGYRDWAVRQGDI